jgi:hypothetical protein
MAPLPEAADAADVFLDPDLEEPPTPEPAPAMGRAAAAGRPAPARTLARSLLPAVGPVLVVAVAVVALGLGGRFLLRSGRLPIGGPPAAPGAASTKPVGTKYDGRWSGETSAGDPVEFRVSGGKLVSFHIEYSIESSKDGAFTSTQDMDFGQSAGGGLDVAPDGTFSNRDSNERIEGAFRAFSKAEGTFYARDPFKEWETSLTWKAKRG